MKLKKLVRSAWRGIAPLVYRLTSKHTKIKISELFDTPTMTKYHHIVVALRYIAVEEYFGENNFGKDIYVKANHWEGEELIASELARFEKLLRSVETHGYNDKFKIYVDLNGVCFNGTHRLALCAWFGVREIPAIIVRRRLNVETVEQAKNYFNLSEEEYRLLEEAYARMYARIASLFKEA